MSYFSNTTIRVGLARESRASDALDKRATGIGNDSLTNSLEALWITGTLALPESAESLHVDPAQSPNVVARARWPIERGAHKRVVSDEVTLTFHGAHHPAINWSPGGILIADSHPEMPIGAKVSGILSIRGHGGFFRFTAELVRRDAQAGQVAFRFEKLSPTLLDALRRLAEWAANLHPPDFARQHGVESDEVPGKTHGTPAGAP